MPRKDRRPRTPDRWCRNEHTDILDITCAVARALGPVVGQLELSAGTLVVVDDAGGVQLVDNAELLDTVTTEGRWAVFNPTPYLDPTTATTGEHASSGPRLRAVDHEERSA